MIHPRTIGTLSLTLGLALAGLVTPTWADLSPQEVAVWRERLSRVTVGAECTLAEGSLIGRTQHDVQLGERLHDAKDSAAIGKMLEEGRLIMSARVVTVFVERRDEWHVEIRPKGELMTFWSYTLQLDCQPAHTDTAVAKQTRKGK